MFCSTVTPIKKTTRAASRDWSTTGVRILFWTINPYNFIPPKAMRINAGTEAVYKKCSAVEIQPTPTPTVVTIWDTGRSSRANQARHIHTRALMCLRPMKSQETAVIHTNIVVMACGWAKERNTCKERSKCRSVGTKNRRISVRTERKKVMNPKMYWSRSEERRGGEECRCRWGA